RKGCGHCTSNEGGGQSSFSKSGHWILRGLNGSYLVVQIEGHIAAASDKKHHDGVPIHLKIKQA
ncbi:MAG: hypothetical protein V7703_11855, partial [Hyphomicrobiales bacterium]